MRKIALFALIIALIVPFTISAQDGWQTYENNDSFRFNYPSDWILTETEESIILTNFEDIDLSGDAITQDLSTDQIVIEFEISDLAETEGAENMLITSDFWAGAYLSIYALFYQTNPQQSFRIESDYDNYILDLANEEKYFRLAVFTTNTHILLVNIAMPLDELDQHEETIMTILESIELHDEN